jgi:hypothetical protein
MNCPATRNLQILYGGKMPEKRRNNAGFVRMWYENADGLLLIFSHLHSYHHHGTTGRLFRRAPDGQDGGFGRGTVKCSKSEANVCLLASPLPCRKIAPHLTDSHIEREMTCH